MAQFRIDQNKFLADSKTIYEVSMFGDRLSPSGTMTDAFGRLRISEPTTLFDSFHRYRENNKFETSTSGTANTEYQINESVVDMNVGTTSGDKCYRQSKRVFAYQPGKSLLIMNTFVMNEPKANLRQRVGYFNDLNGVFLENDGTTNYLVLRSYSSGSVVETRVAQTDWNVDSYTGTGAASQSVHHSGDVDVTKSNIFWVDVEWLGVGDVRCGFVTGGIPRIAHVFHNDNENTTTYMTTAVLPIRYEIENTGTTASASKMKQICSTVISEGGYEVRGNPYSYGLEPGSPRAMATAGTYYPVLSIRLKSARNDAIVVPSNLNLISEDAAVYKYQIRSGATLTGSVWTSAGGNSAVEYDANNSSTMTGGTVLSSGYFTTTNQAAGAIQLAGDIFKYQLERDGMANTSIPLTLAVTHNSVSSVDIFATLDWEEFT